MHVESGLAVVSAIVVLGGCCFTAVGERLVVLDGGKADAGPQPDGGGPTGCTIGGVAYADGTADPMNECRSCQVSVSPSAWTDLPTGSPCAQGGFCAAGVCLHGCLIDGGVVPSGTIDPGGCLECLPASSRTSWTHLPDGTSCGDAGTPAICTSGSCQPGCLIAGVFHVPSDRNSQNPCETCQPLASTSQWSELPAGAGCGGTRTCDSMGHCEDPDAGCAGYAAQFDSPTLLPTDGISWQLLSADLSLSGIPDLINVTFGGLLVLPGLPDGGFGPFTRYLSHEQLSAALVRDLNGDGYPDVAVIRDITRVEFLSGQSGGGLAPGGAGIALPEVSYSIAAATLSGASPDLIVCGISKATTYLNDGHGAYTVGSDILDGGCAFLEVADLSGSGRGDAILSGNTETTVLLSTGPRSYGPGTVLPVGGRLAVADFDGDGDQDLAVVDQAGVHLFLNQGDGSLLAGTLTPLGFQQPSPQQVAAADLNGDCRPDLVVAASSDCNAEPVGSLYAFLNVGQADGGFLVVDLKSGGLTRPEGVAIVSFPGARPAIAATDYCAGELALVPEFP